MNDTMYDLPQDIEPLLNMLERKNFDEVSCYKDDSGNSEYEFVYYGEENHKRSIFFDVQDDGLLQQLLNWIRKQYAWD